MQDSNRIELLGVIMVNLKPILPLLSQLKFPPHPEITVRKIYKSSKYSIAFLMNSFFKETEIDGKIFKYAALDIVRTNATKEKK